MSANLICTLDEAARRYRATLDGVEVACIEIDPTGADSMLIRHTEVPSMHEGKGHGSAIVRALLDEMRARGKTETGSGYFSQEK